MSELDLDTILKAASSDAVGKNADSILGMLQEITRILAEMDKVMGFLKKMESSILISTAVRLKAKQAGIELTPLSSNDGLIPASENHGKVMENINKLTQEQLGELMNALKEYDAKKNPKPVEGNGNAKPKTEKRAYHGN